MSRPLQSDLLLVLVLTALELYRPMLTGDAIDLFIAGDYAPGEAVEERFTGVLIAAGAYVAVLAALFVCNRVQFCCCRRRGRRSSMRCGGSSSPIWRACPCGFSI